MPTSISENQISILEKSKDIIRKSFIDIRGGTLFVMERPNLIPRKEVEWVGTIFAQPRDMGFVPVNAHA
jgi:hypothetical protein